MDLLIKKLVDNKKFNDYVKDIKNKISPISLSGLTDVGKAQLIVATLKEEKRPICIVTYNEMQASKLAKDLKYFLSANLEDSCDVIYFPKKEISPYDYISQSKDLPFERMKILNTYNVYLSRPQE